MENVLFSSCEFWEINRAPSPLFSSLMLRHMIRSVALPVTQRKCQGHSRNRTRKFDLKNEYARTVVPIVVCFLAIKKNIFEVQSVCENQFIGLLRVSSVPRRLSSNRSTRTNVFENKVWRMIFIYPPSRGAPSTPPPQQLHGMPHKQQPSGPAPQQIYMTQRLSWTSALLRSLTGMHIVVEGSRLFECIHPWDRSARIVGYASMHHPILTHGQSSKRMSNFLLMGKW